MTQPPENPPLAADDAELPGVAGYRVVRRIGLGGMATVYLAVQESLERQVAIKVMAPYASADEQQAQRFEHEARVIAKLEHPSIVGIHEVGRTREGRLYYVMPYLASGDLSHRDLRDDEPRILEVLRALLDALAYAHARGVVHRDVKAENVLFDASDRPKLADFGIALSKRTVTRITGAGLTLGSGGYMAPEQSRGEDVDGRADLYGVGVLAFELLTGELPYRADDALALAMMHGHDPIPRLPPAKRHWQGFIDQAMAKNPDRRFRNANAMLRALEPIERRVTGGGVTVPELAHALVHDPAWRKPWVLIAAGLLLAAGVSALLWTVATPSRPTQANGAPTPAAGALPIDDQVLARALGQADNQFVAGQVIEPAGANAAETWLGVLRMEPGNDAARDGLSRSFDWLGRRFEQALEAVDIESAQLAVEQARLLADSGGETLSGELDAFEARARALLERGIRRALAARDDDVSRRLSGLSVALGFQQRLSPEIRVASSAERGSAAMASDGEPAAEAEAAPAGHRLVSLAEFTQFSEGRNRQEARCRARLSPLRLVDERNWRDPGTGQGKDDPVVCVAYSDALALAGWMAAREGGRWRLPGPAEVAQFDLPLPVWTGGCGDNPNPLTRLFDRDDCPRRITAGGAGDPRALEPDRGYEDVGVLLLREPG